MASLTIRKLDESIKSYLRLRAAGNGRSVEFLQHNHAQVDRPPRQFVADRRHLKRIAHDE